MKIRVWCDSGANIHSRREFVINLEEVTGLSNEDWLALPENEQEECMRDIACDKLDWGWQVLPDGD